MGDLISMVMLEGSYNSEQWENSVKSGKLAVVIILHRCPYKLCFLLVSGIRINCKWQFISLTV